ncbi:Nucleotide-diphospho-sugar transferases,Glycosyltransferase 2-like,Ricin B, lectin [Cinara cedri]|uniref:Polypeptide N-acetylgalactosaminyltransferase n=1 Tax=Cinara cedri TaxID=506608 RepID=A0A5E4N5N6_9HEMI|nr:Nucleotide-diphospho-sugar transferases,Glycosyltransferase 2-like,Ricin B, lectin [Cinara cedri]
MTLRFRIIQLKRSRFAKISIGTFIILLLLFALYIRSENIQNSRESAFPRHSKFLNSIPIYHDKILGNFEYFPPINKPGPGENGQPHHVPSDRENEALQSLSEYGMNMACSDDISLNRSIPDLRMEECKYWTYPEVLPRTSVIIVFHNEGWSSLLRTVHSILNRTPPQFLEEILLVDDFSNKENLKTKLEYYIEKFNGKVKLIRNTEREGLIRTRSKGAFNAVGEIILFLDAHCEVGYNWLPPLIAPIARDRKIMTVPVIDGIDHNTWEFRPVYGKDDSFRGIFEWGMLYKEIELPAQEEKKRTYKSEPYKSPTHAGGLFAMDRSYFLELGAYDPGLLVWGGENFELSFKIWQCGGSIEWVPCSRVGHVYRGFMPYNFGELGKKVKGPLITYNYKRVIETWFDDKHKEFFYTREPLARYLDMGDITKQLELKDKLQCKDFSWFMENVAYDVYTKFPELPPNLHWGELRNIGKSTCLDTRGRQPPSLVGLELCHGQGNNQLFRLNTKGQLAVGERCIAADRQNVKLVACPLGTVDGPWQYESTNKLLLHTITSKCLSVHPSSNQLILTPCDGNNANQQWAFKTIMPKWTK